MQRYFTRRLFPKAAFSYRERLFLLELEGLESRRLKADIKMYCKIFHGLVELKPNDFFTFFNFNKEYIECKINYNQQEGFFYYPNESQIPLFV